MRALEPAAEFHRHVSRQGVNWLKTAVARGTHAMLNLVTNRHTGDIETMLELANRIVGLARSRRGAAIQAGQDALKMRAELRPLIEHLGKEEGFRKRYVAAMLPMILEGAMDHTDAEMGNIQLCNGQGSLKIVVQSGFNLPFLEYFDSVHAGQAACGWALQNAGRVVVRDVTDSPIFHNSPALEVVLDAGVRSVQSTPLLSASGRVLGVLSTHSGRLKDLCKGELARVDHFARWAAALLQWRDSGVFPQVS